MTKNEEWMDTIERTICMRLAQPLILIMITMQQYDLIRHLNKILKRTVFFFIFCSLNLQCMRTHSVWNTQRKIIIVLCLRIVFLVREYIRTFGRRKEPKQKKKRERKKSNENWWAIEYWERRKKYIHKNLMKFNGCILVCVRFHFIIDRISFAEI